MTVNAKKEIVKQQCHAQFPFLITVDTGKEVFHYSNTDEDITDTETGIVYQGKAFSIKPFSLTDSKIGNGTFTIYDCSLEWIPIIREAGSKFDINFISAINYFTNNSFTLEKIEELQGKLSDFSWGDDDTITCTINFDEDIDIVMPLDRMDSIICPALF